jgi:hypothetical protein
VDVDLPSDPQGFQGHLEVTDEAQVEDPAKAHVNKGRNHYIHSTLGPSRVDVRFLGNYKVDVAHIRPEWNGCTHVDL